MQMLAHHALWIPLNDQIDISLLIFVADRRVRANRWLLHLGAFVLCQQRRRDLQTRDAIGIGERKAEFLCVVVDVFYGLELEVDETLFAACEGSVDGCLRGGGAGRGFGRDILLLGR